MNAARTARVYEMCDLLQRHNMPFAFQRADSEAGAAILQTAGVDADTGPVVVLQDGRIFVDPSNIEIADALGARTRPGSGTYDVVSSAADRPVYQRPCTRSRRDCARR